MIHQKIKKQLKKYVESSEFRADANSLIMGLGIGAYAGISSSQETFVALAGVTILMMVTGQVYEKWLTKIKNSINNLPLGGKEDEIVRRLTKEPESSLIGGAVGYFGYLLVAEGPASVRSTVVDIVGGLL